MPRLNTATRYGHVPRLLHWTSVVLLVLVLVTSARLDPAAGTGATNPLVAPHVAAGLLLLAVMCVRLWLRVRSPNPVDSFTVHRLQRYAAYCVHRTIYGLILTLCATGVVMTLAMPSAPALGGLLDVPRLLAGDNAAVVVAARLHAALTLAVYPLFALHIGAAIVHQLFGMRHLDDKP